MDDVVKLLLLMTFILVVLGSLLIAVKQLTAGDSEINDPNRNHYITRSDDTLIHGEVYEREFVPAHIETRRRTEMQAGMGFGVNPANGNLEHHYGFFPVTVNYTVEIPDAYVLRIFAEDMERLIYYVNELNVAENVFDEYEVGDIFGTQQENVKEIEE